MCTMYPVVLSTNLWDVCFGNPEITIEQSPEKPGSDGPGKVLTETKEKLGGEGPQHSHEEDRPTTNLVWYPAPHKTSSEATNKVGAA